MRELVKNENGMFSSDRINYNNSITDGKVSKNPFISSPLADAGDFSFTFENENGEFIGFLKGEAENKIVIIGNPSYGKTNAFYQIFEIASTGKDLGLGFPPASDMTVGSASDLNISRIADGLRFLPLSENV